MSYATLATRRIDQRERHPNGYDSRTLTGALVLSMRDAQNLRIDAGGTARAITLPTVSAQDAGASFVIFNAGGEDLTLNTNLLVLAEGDLGIVYVTTSGAWAVFAHLVAPSA